MKYESENVVSLDKDKESVINLMANHCTGY